MSSRQMEENDAIKRAEFVANELGITVDELESTNWEIDSHDGSDGAVYGHYVRFSDDSPKEVLDKIEGLEGNCVDISIQDEPDQDDYFDPNDDGSEILTDDERKLGDRLLKQLGEEAKRKGGSDNI